MALIMGGTLEEIIYARLDAGADLQRGIEDVCRQRDIRTGLILSLTGSLLKARLQRFTEKGDPQIGHRMTVEPVEVPGPLEATGHGFIGEAYAPTLGDKPFGGGGALWRHGDVYTHVHMVVTSAEETVCGHLLEGCLVRSPHPLSHFMVAIARTKGVQLRFVGDEQGFFNDLVEA